MNKPSQVHASFFAAPHASMGAKIEGVENEALFGARSSQRGRGVQRRGVIRGIQGFCPAFRRSAALPVGVLGLLIAALTAFGQEHAGKGAAKDSKQPHCPVMGDEPANLAIKVETNEGPVFFCCKECVGKYQADPGKYAAKVAAQRKALADRPKVQVTCPTCKEAADAKISMEIEGKKIFFSSTECLNKYKSEPGKYAAALANSYTYQTKCPVMGEEIDPKAFTTLANGMRVYYCCKGCDKKLLADPAKYAGKLAAQGIVLEPKDLVAAPAKDQSGQGG